MKSWMLLSSVSCPRWNINLTTMKFWLTWAASFITQTDSYTALINSNSWFSNSDINLFTNLISILWSICTAKFLRHFVVFFDFLKISSFQNEKLATQADQKWTPRWAWNEMLAHFLVTGKKWFCLRIFSVLDFPQRLRICYRFWLWL